jgi:predicted Zn-dependent protease
MQMGITSTGDRRPAATDRMGRPRALVALAAALAMVLAQLLAPAARAQAILRDAETESFMRDLATPLMKAAGLDPRTVEFYLVGDPSINAFATGGQRVFFHSGLFLAAEDVNQVQGVMAHELGHVAGGHSIRWNEGVAPAQSISILSLLVGVAAMALGAGQAGMAALAAGQQIAQAQVLAFNREQESRTDQAAARYLQMSRTTGKGMISFFEQLRGQEYRMAIPQDNSYGRTHPLSGERILALEQVLMESPYWDAPVDPVLQARYARIRGKLIGYLYPLDVVQRAYPATDTSDAAHFARGYAYHRAAMQKEALVEIEAVVARSPNDPYSRELMGQILLESGDVADALPPLREAVRLSGGNPLIAGMLGHALLLDSHDGNDKVRLAEAERVLRSVVNRDSRNPFAWMQLGNIYELKGDQPRAALASAEQINLSGGDPRVAARAARLAMAGLPEGSPDYLRAEDIAFVAQGEIERQGLDRKGSPPPAPGNRQ